MAKKKVAKKKVVLKKVGGGIESNIEIGIVAIKKLFYERRILII